MKDFYAKLFLGLLALFFLSAHSEIKAECTYANLTLDQVVQNINGSYDLTMTFCTTGGYDGCTDITGAFGFFVEGGAKVIGHPATMTSPQTGETFTGVVMSYSTPSDVVVYHDNGYYIWWTCVDNTCGPSVPVCATITITTDILPTKVICGGMEGMGVLVAPYCCTGPNLEVFPNPNFPPPPCYTFNLVADLGNDIDVLYSYQGSECTTISATTTGNGTLPYSYAWSNGSTNSTISVCPSSTTNYSVTITDAAGCTTTDDMTVNVEDIFCGNNKVYMCKPNGTTRCVRVNRVQSKLNNGWTLGPCGSSNSRIGSGVTEMLLTNESIPLESRKRVLESGTVRFYTMDGHLVGSLEAQQNNSSAQMLDQLSLPNGMYLKVYTDEDGGHQVQKIYKMN